MTTLLWEILAICIVTGVGALAYLWREAKIPKLAVTEDAMMHVIANHTLLQHYFNDGDEIRDVQILKAVHSQCGKGTLVQALCKRTTDGNQTIRLYFVMTDDKQYSPYLLRESTRSLDWGNRLTFYDELAPIAVTIYSGHWVEAVYQELRLENFNGVTLNWEAEERRIKFALTKKQQASVLIIPINPLNN